MLKQFFSSLKSAALNRNLFPIHHSSGKQNIDSFTVLENGLSPKSPFSSFFKNHRWHLWFDLKILNICILQANRLQHF